MTKMEQKIKHSLLPFAVPITGAALSAISAFALNKQDWLANAAKSGVLKKWSADELKLFEAIALPQSVGEYSQLLDQAINIWPSSSRLLRPQVTKLSALVAESSLLDDRVGQLLQAIPHAFTSATGEHLQAITGFEATPEAQKIAEQEINLNIGRGADAKHLSPTARQYLIWIWLVVEILMKYLALQNGARSELCFMVPKAPSAMTSTTYVKVVRAAMCEAAIPAQEFARYRIVKGENVRLRTEPGMKSALVSLSLQNLDLLEVLDDSDRDWLYVSVVNEEGVSGWVSRKYTHRLNR